MEQSFVKKVKEKIKSIEILLFKFYFENNKMNRKSNLVFILFIILIQTIFSAYNWEKLNLPDNHIPYYFFRNSKIKQMCANDDKCPFKHHVSNTKCLGYENKCKVSDRLNLNECPGDSKSKIFFNVS